MRYDLFVDAVTLAERFDVPPDQISINFSPPYDVRPTNSIPGVIMLDGVRSMQPLRWGLVPVWAKDIKVGRNMFNARAETIDSKFRNQVRKQRCLLPATAFIEWQDVPGEKRKQPYRFSLQSGDPFAFAGVWDSWRPSEGDPIRSASMVTCEPNMLVETLHNRMPVMLLREVEKEWIDQSNSLEQALSLLKPYPAELMKIERWYLELGCSAEMAADCNSV